MDGRPSQVDAAATFSHDCARAKRFRGTVVVPALVGHSETEWLGRVRLTVRITTAQANNATEGAAIRRRIVVARAHARGVVRACGARRGGAAREREMGATDRGGSGTVGRRRTREQGVRWAAGRGCAGIRLCREIRAADLIGVAPDGGSLRSARRSGRRRGTRIGARVRSDSRRCIRHPAGSCVHPRVIDPRIDGLLGIRHGIERKRCAVVDIGALVVTRFAVRRTSLNGFASGLIGRICVDLRTIAGTLSIFVQSTQNATRAARDRERHHSPGGRKAHPTTLTMKAAVRQHTGPGVELGAVRHRLSDSAKTAIRRRQKSR